LTRAVIVGSGGQDGKLLLEYLKGEGATVVGLTRGSIDVRDARDVAALLDQFRPTEVYYLAAVHRSAEEQDRGTQSELWRSSTDVHVIGLVSFLEWIRLNSPETRLFYASSCLVFGRPPTARQNELTPIDPRSAYAITKAAGWQCCRMYRRTHSVFASVGILYTHESPLRSDGFVSQRIVRGAIGIRNGKQNELIVGDLSAEVDWGYAPDFVRAMTEILRLAVSDDFVIATGEGHTVGEFARLAFAAVGLNWQDYVRQQPSLLSESRPSLVGDASKLRRETGWRPSLTFEQLVATLVATRNEALNQVAARST
jgi:GDPmannose 4,6-dehydratase